MHILIVSQHFWPENFRINDLASELISLGHQVSVLTGQPNYPEGKVYEGYSKFSLSVEKYRGVDIYRVPLIPRGRSGALSLSLNYLSFIISASTIGFWKTRNKSFDKVLVYGTSPILQAFPALLIGRLKGVKVAVWVQDLWPQSLKATGYVNSKFLLGCVGVLVSWIYKSSDILLAQSEPFIKAIKQLSGKTRVVYLPQPGDSTNRNSDVTSPKLILSKNFNLVFAGNLGVAQSLDTLVEAADLLSNEIDIHFYLVGSGSQTEKIQALIKKKNLSNISLPGRFNAEDMPAIYKQASVLLVSLLDSDIFNMTIPGKIQSYLAQGKPILASMNGEGARIVNEANAGLATPANNPKLLAEAVLKLKNMPSYELEIMGKNATNFFSKNYEIGSVAQKLISILST